MSFKIGDPIFDSSGRPGLIKDKDPRTGGLTVERSHQKVQENIRHGYLKDLGTLRSDFNAIMDEIKDIENAREMIETLQSKIYKLEDEVDSPHDLKMIKYLRSELFHLMQTHQISPREYRILPTT